MKKRNIIFIAFILLLSFWTNSVKAYSYSQANISINKLKNNGWIITWPNTEMRASDSAGAVLAPRNNFYFNEVVDGSKSYVSYASGLNKSLPSENYNYLLTLQFDFTTLQNSTNNLSDSQKQLLRYLLVSGYHPTSNTIKVNTLLNNKSDTLSMIAMQVLVWEIMEGGRTSFNSIAPNWNGENSYFPNTN
jgi:hypothetical protein